MDGNGHVVDYKIDVMSKEIIGILAYSELNKKAFDRLSHGVSDVSQLIA